MRPRLPPFCSMKERNFLDAVIAVGYNSGLFMPLTRLALTIEET
jgi:hypothetical protein